MIRVKKFMGKTIPPKTAEEQLEEFLNEIGEADIIQITQGFLYNAISKAERLCYTVIYRE